MAGFLKLIKSALLSFFIRAEIVEDKLKIFARRAKHDLILTTIEIVVVNLDQTIIDKNVSVDDVEHTAQLDVFIHRVHESNWIEMVNTTVLLYYEAPFNELASKLVQFRRIVNLFRKKSKGSYFLQGFAVGDHWSNCTSSYFF